jgi:hypothetical protein
MQIVAESIQFPVTSFALRSAAKNCPMYIDYQSLTSLWSMQFGRVAKIDIRLLMFYNYGSLISEFLHLSKKWCKYFSLES